MTITEALHWSTNPSGFGPLASVIGVALHHTVTSISPDATPAEEEAHARAIDRYHVGQGWGGIGYHYFVFPSGRAYRVGWGQRAHVAHRNHELVGIAWVATLTDRTPSDIEVSAAAEAVRDAWTRIGGEVPLRGHREWAVAGWSSACPGRGTEVIPRVGKLARGQEEKEMTKEEIEALVNQRVDAALAAQFRPLLNLAINGGQGAYTDPQGKPLPLIRDNDLVGRVHALEQAGPDTAPRVITITGATIKGDVE